MNVQLTISAPVSLRERVGEALREAITNCRIEQGGRLVERELCESMGVSRSTIREVLRQLEAEGLVEIRPHRGPQVATLSAEDAAELYVIRAPLEAEAVALVARNADEAALERFAGSLARMEAAEQDGDFVALQAAKTDFYRELFEASGNRQLASMLRQLRARMALVREIDVERPARMRESVRGAREVLEAVRRGDTRAARAASRQHIERAARLALAAMEDGGRPGGGRRRRRQTTT